MLGSNQDVKVQGPESRVQSPGVAGSKTSSEYVRELIRRDQDQTRRISRSFVSARGSITFAARRLSEHIFQPLEDIEERVPKSEGRIGHLTYLGSLHIWSNAVAVDDATVVLP